MSTENYKNFHIYRFEIVWKRILDETDINNQMDLAGIVGVRQATISKRKKQNIWPEEWAYRIGKKYNLLTEWILSGKGPKRISNISNGIQYRFPILKDIDQWLVEEIEGNHAEKNAWFSLEMQRQFIDFKEWKKRKDESESKDNFSASDNVA